MPASSVREGEVMAAVRLGLGGSDGVAFSLKS